MASNEIDIYWLRVKIRDRLPEFSDKALCNITDNDLSEYDYFYHGLNTILDLLEELTGVDYSDLKSDILQ